MTTRARIGFSTRLGLDRTLGRRCQLILAVAFVGFVAPAASAQDSAPAEDDTLGRPCETLSLGECIQSAMVHNKTLIQARHKLKEVGGRALISKSRFFPHLEVLGDYNAWANDESSGAAQTQYAGTARLSQRILEFGRDTDTDIDLREEHRSALYEYEAAVREVLSQVRRSFFSVLLREEQISIRKALLADFRQKLERAKAKRERKIVIPLDVLRAELDVLNEELRINSLVKDQFNRKRQLLELIGRPMGIDVSLVGELTELVVEEQEAVQAALDNSFRVTLAQQRVAEQKRALRKVLWDRFPDLTVEAGITSGDNALGVGVSGSERTWGLDVSLERSFAGSNGSLDVADPSPERFARVEFSIPVFDGLESTGRMKAQKANLRRLQADLERQEDLVELDVRIAYQALLEAREAWRIQERRVQISKRRLEIQERLKEAGLVGELEIEHFRDQFFEDQDQFFLDQDNYVSAQEDIRKLMGWFE